MPKKTVILNPAADKKRSIARADREQKRLKIGALQKAIQISANFSSIATDASGVIQIFNVGAERMLGYAASDVINKLTPADISDPDEVVARARALSVELNTPIAPGFEALVFKASRGIEDIYELTYIRKNGSHFPAVVSVTALKDTQEIIIGYLLIGTDNSARKLLEAEQKQLGQRLRDYQFYTRSLFESNIDALMISDSSGIITDANKQMELMTGCTREELIGAPFKNYFTDPERAEAGINQVLNEQTVTNYELTARARDGRETVVSYNGATLYDRDRRLQGVFGAARDITELKRSEVELKESENRFRFMLENSPIAACITNKASGQVVFANQRYAELIAVSHDKVIGIDPKQYYSTTQQGNDPQLGKGDVVSNKLLELNFNIDQVEKKWVLASYLKLDFQHEPAVMGWFYDITERKEMEDQIRQLAFYDPLTNLPNRRLLDDRLRQVMSVSKRNKTYCALMFIDLDKFKLLNDTEGHAVGDLLLVEVAHRLRACVREMDTVARFGGDEFVVMLSELDTDKDTSRAQAEVMAEKIRTGLSAPYKLVIVHEGKANTTVRHRSSASIGVVVFVDHQGDAEEILNWSDKAMYQAKEAGRNAIGFYDPLA